MPSLVACARADDRWALLYRILWRLVHGEPRLLDVAVDDKGDLDRESFIVRIVNGKGQVVETLKPAWAK